YTTLFRSLDGGQAVFDGRVEFFINFGGVPVFFPTDNADFNFQNLFIEGGALQQLFCDAQVFGYGFGRTVPHVRLEDWVAAGVDFGFGGLHLRDDLVNEFIALG